jgi:1-acyl-sn-glycerol-3-phosphate acyltransferase
MRRVMTVLAYFLLFWILLPALLFGTGLWLDARMHLALPPSVFRVVLGVVVAGASAALLLTSLYQFRRFGAALPVSALPPDRIIQKGLFMVWRHPIYLFFTLTLFGAGLALGSGAMLLIVLPVFAVSELVYIASEERALVRRFGVAYVNYRRRTPLILPWVGHLLRGGLHIVFRGLFAYEVRHKERIPAPPFFVIAAHRNYLDPFFIAQAVGYPVQYVTTFEMFRTPLLRIVFQALGTIPKRRYLSDVRAAREIAKAIREQRVLGIFPEGERSWTGATSAWKPEVARLLRRHAEIPVLPVRIDGNYVAWPRWGRGLRRAKVMLTIQPPVAVDPQMPAPVLEQRLRQLVEPDDTGLVCRSPDRARDIARLIYRCLVCRSWDGLAVTGPSLLACRECRTSFELLPDYAIRYRQSGLEVTLALDAAFERVRVRPDDLPAAADAGQAEPVIARSWAATFWVEHGTKLVPQALGQLALTSLAIRFGSPTYSMELPLAALRSVTIESNRKLQLYDAGRRQLFQVTFEDESALKWQDFIVQTMRIEQRLVPNTR